MIVKFVEDPKYFDHMDEIVHFHQDFGLSGPEVDEFKSLFLQMSID